jgi:hypothetical protein
VNGVGGVVASSGAIALALSYGLSWLFVVAALCYLALIPLVRVLQNAPREAPPAP